MTKKIAFLFPGQGSQVVGMGKDLYESYTVVKDIYDRANEILKKDVVKLCFEGPEESLKETINTQPCIVTTSIAAKEALQYLTGISPDYVAGHSLGEYSAMYTAGVMSLDTTLNSIQKRAELMQEVSGGSMSAVLNATDEQIKSALEEARKIGYVDIANYNSPSQIVLTGEEKALDAASKFLLSNGVKRVIPLPVSGAFHSKMIEDAAKEFYNYVSDIELLDAKIPVYTNVDAAATTFAEDFRQKMPVQITSSVYWTQTIQAMISNGVEIFVEIGPGKVLAGLNKKIDTNVTTYNVYDKMSLENTAEALKALLTKV